MEKELSEPGEIGTIGKRRNNLSGTLSQVKGADILACPFFLIR